MGRGEVRLVPKVSKKALSAAGRLLVQGAIDIGAAGGEARAKSLSPARRKEIARMGGLARHGIRTTTKKTA